MARGSDGKARRKDARKEARAADAERLLKEGNENDFDLKAEDEIPFPMPPSASADAPTEENNSSSSDEEPVAKKSKRKGRRSAASSAGSVPAAAKKEGIKTLPLVMLIMLTGTTLLPALLYAGDWVGGFIQKNHIMGTLGHKLGIGPSPKKRVLSFYEKHDPTKLDEVDGILGKYYGEYPKLIKRLERKYGDYGYFLNWEQDEAPMTLAFEKLADTRDFLQKKFDMHAPQFLKTAARNIRFNLTTLYKKFSKVWKKSIWPTLEPIFGVPEGGAAQKRKDKMNAMNNNAKGGRRKKNTEFRDDVDE